MPAYLKRIETLCQTCRAEQLYAVRPATLRLYSTSNEPLGDYCAWHSQAALAAQEAHERTLQMPTAWPSTRDEG